MRVGARDARGEGPSGGWRASRGWSPTGGVRVISSRSDPRVSEAIVIRLSSWIAATTSVMFVMVAVGRSPDSSEAEQSVLARSLGRRKCVQQLFEVHVEHVVGLHVEHVVHGEATVSSRSARTLEPRGSLSAAGSRFGQALDPVVDPRERDWCEAVGIDADVELVTVRAMIAGGV